LERTSLTFDLARLAPAGAAQTSGADLKRLYDEAFPAENLLPLVTSLEAHGDVHAWGAFIDGQLIGHVLLTPVTVTGSELAFVLLGPLAILPRVQRKGAGSALVRHAVAALPGETAGALVLGDPGYYSRFGFQHETAITPPYALPIEWQGAWQSLRLNGKHRWPSGALVVPHPWAKPALWLP